LKFGERDAALAAALDVCGNRGALAVGQCLTVERVLVVEIFGEPIDYLLVRPLR
jgi:hypothetical protein